MKDRSLQAVEKDLSRLWEVVGTIVSATGMMGVLRLREMGMLGQDFVTNGWFKNPEAVALGLVATGVIITTAGIITASNK